MSEFDKSKEEMDGEIYNLNTMIIEAISKSKNSVSRCDAAGLQITKM